MKNTLLFDDSLQLLKNLIVTPSFSKEENKTADIIEAFFNKKNISTKRKNNNVWVYSKYRNNALPTILLNSHHDTVKPAKGYTRDPFKADIENGKLYGLGSNDAGASLVALIAVFLHFYEQKNLPFNLVLAATAEEEISGKNGIASVLSELGKIDLGIIGEPTQMRMAIAEKGLMVVDGYAKGKSGHAAREEGVNALYVALKDIDWIKNYVPEKVSNLLGNTKMSVTQIQAGTQHNVVPDSCHFVVDVRTNELYTNEAIFDILQQNTVSDLKARSFRLSSSGIALTHPVVQRGLSLGLSYFGSPTLSDQALIQGFPTLKIGCGKSARSHTADEFVEVAEIAEGIEIYIKLLENLSM